MNEMNAVQIDATKDLHRRRVRLSAETIDYLIEQAERVPELEKENKILSCLYYSMEKHGNEIREKCKLAYGEIFELKVEKSVRGILDKVELSDDAKELNLRLMKTNVENMRLREALEQIMNIDGVFMGWNEEFNAETAYQMVDDIARQALEGKRDG